MLKTTYEVKATFKITVDAAKPDTLAKAAKWIEELGAGKVITPPEELTLEVEIIGSPKIVNRREKD